MAGIISTIQDGRIKMPTGAGAGPADPVSIPALMVAFCIVGFSLACGVFWLSAIGLGASAYYFTRLVLEYGHSLPIESLILVICSLQWIVGPECAYLGLSNHYKFRMYVPEEEYMALAVPGVMLFSVGLYCFRVQKRAALIRDCAAITGEIVTRSRRLPVYLICVGFIFSYLVGRVPATLEFPVYLCSNIKYIGLIYLLFSDWLTDNRIPLLVAFCFTFMSSLHSAMFHDLLLWSAFVGMYAAYLAKPSLKQKWGLFLLAVFFVCGLQIVKDEYRMQLLQQGQSDYFSKFLIVMDKELLQDEVLVNDKLERVVVRINQGWIISRIMQQVPAVTPFADGETIITAIETSILPRALFPDKPIAGGRENFEKYTGFKLQKNTAMGISLLGEAYINFGTEGAWVFMLGFGVLTALILRGIFQLTGIYPTLWLWLPLILLHFVKAETELLVQLNYLYKSIFLVLLFIWINRTFFKWRL